MPLYKLTIKFYVAQDTFAPAEFVPVFHHWIQNQSLAEHLLIDVADYAHVPCGPGTLVVASQANIHMDRSNNRLGLLYVRKTPVNGVISFPETLKAIFKYALAAAIKMQSESALDGRLKFRTDEITIRLNDRLIAPNSPETVAEYHPLVVSFAKILFPAEKVTVEPCSKTPKHLIDLCVKSSGQASLTDLIERIA